jgi:hypothetical protein
MRAIPLPKRETGNGSETTPVWKIEDRSNQKERRQEQISL